nr:hypothetical protein [Tanacetum cinerariifolium]
DIDSLTKSMNYVPVDAGTKSTNLSGTKDTANQEVNKNESLRYIVLPNWAHDAFLESTSSKLYEESISQVPEGSGNPNPTASAFDPPADQMETLTIIGPVDTPIQTRHKSNMVEEQSFMATFHQKTDPALLQFCLYPCFLSQVEPKKVSDALQDPSWVEAMQEE